MVSTDVCRVEMSWTPIDSGADGKGGDADPLLVKPSKRPASGVTRSVVKREAPCLGVPVFGKAGRDESTW